MALRDSRKDSRGPSPVIPAKAEIQTLGKRHWIPAFAGMTYEPHVSLMDNPG
jgi:hypothetical protein